VTSDARFRLAALLCTESQGCQSSSVLFSELSMLCRLHDVYVRGMIKNDVFSNAPACDRSLVRALIGIVQPEYGRLGLGSSFCDARSSLEQIDPTSSKAPDSACKKSIHSLRLRGNESTLQLSSLRICSTERVAFR
jgi:hypothetical protein